MNLVASLICKNERARYLEPCIDHLLTFCDAIRVVNDASTDGSDEWLVSRDDRIQVADLAGTSFFEHEGRARQVLLDFTLKARPSHILAIDLDELVTDGAAIRAACDTDDGPGAWTLEMTEVWKADQDRLWVRTDGAWRPHRCPILYRVAPGLRIQDAALSCGREPTVVRQLVRSALPSGSDILHLGWLNEAARAGRHHRYVVHDGGKHHNRRHLDSIMWSDRRVRLRPRAWPTALEPWREAILQQAAVAA